MTQLVPSISHVSWAADTLYIFAAAAADTRVEKQDGGSDHHTAIWVSTGDPPHASRNADVADITNVLSVIIAQVLCRGVEKYKR